MNPYLLHKISANWTEIIHLGLPNGLLDILKQIDNLNIEGNLKSFLQNLVATNQNFNNLVADITAKAYGVNNFVAHVVNTGAGAVDKAKNAAKTVTDIVGEVKTAVGSNPAASD